MSERPILFSGPMVRAILDGRKTQTRRVVAWPKHVGGHVVDRVVPAPHYGHGKKGEFVPLNDMGGIATRPFASHSFPCPYGARGDSLWVRETHSIKGQCVAFKADGWCGAACDDGAGGRMFVQHGLIADAHRSAGLPWPSGGSRSFGLPTYGGCWRPSIHLPRAFSRLSLRLTDVRVERLQQISEADAIAEGIECIPEAELVCHCGSDLKGHGWGDGHSFTPMPEHRYEFSKLWDSINDKRAPWSSNPWVWVVSFERSAPSTASETERAT